MRKNNEEVFEIPDKLQVFEDGKSKAKTIALPFQFLDGVSGVVMISRLSKPYWKPSDFIEKVVVTLKQPTQ